MSQPSNNHRSLNGHDQTDSREADTDLLCKTHRLQDIVAPCNEDRGGQPIADAFNGCLRAVPRACAFDRHSSVKQWVEQLSISSPLVVAEPREASKKRRASNSPSPGRKLDPTSGKTHKKPVLLQPMITDNAVFPSSTSLHPGPSLHHATSIGSLGSIGSAGSFGSFGSHASWSGRKGRPKVLTSPYPGDFVIMTWSLKTYHCTWCHKAFSKPSDWKRHEQSQHAPQTEWTCMNNGPCVVVDGHLSCVMCENHIHDPHHSISCPYSIAKCLERDPESRKFDRKDHLLQHLDIFHRLPKGKLPIQFASWESKILGNGTELLWDCGACSKRGLTWAERYPHILKDHAEDINHKGLSWRRCQCTRGYSKNLPVALEKAGLVQDFTITCTVQNNAMDLTAWTSGSCQRNRSFPFPYRVPKSFWCGYCARVIQAKCNGSYDCTRFHHINLYHTETSLLESLVWQEMTPRDERRLYRNAYAVLIREYGPVDLAFEPTVPEQLHRFARRLTRYNKSDKGISQ